MILPLAQMKKYGGRDSFQMGDAYLAEELEQEYAEKVPVNVHGS